MLEGWLDYHRATLAMKCAGLDDAQMRRRPVEPSKLSLAGLVRHMAEVERHWFRRVLLGEDVDDVWGRPGADFDDVETTDIALAFTSWEEECRLARQASAAAVSVEVIARRLDWGREVSLRWILVHMVEEYARHNGHADLLRERIDGVIGE